ncbi:DUF4174 domain-containing protein [Paenirhodobacter sp.]|uniref:DUF4174 domain-containing protein n=1 Tax=Paenirhodobacter sp. TaxID=1965326 RepID=UPI003B3DF09F
MTRTLRLAALIACLALPLAAQDFAPLTDTSVRLEDFIWQKRPVVVFADSPADPAFVEQMRALEAGWPDLAARDVVILTDTDPAAAGPARKALRPRGFSIVLIEKDGTVASRKPTPRDARELSHAIDKMPIRREEMRARRGAPGL